MSEATSFSVVNTTEAEDFGALEFSVDGALAGLSISTCSCTCSSCTNAN